MEANTTINSFIEKISEPLESSKILEQMFEDYDWENNAEVSIEQERLFKSNMSQSNILNGI